MAELLRLTDVHAGYGDARVLEALDFAMDEGESLALLGRNGAGKTTLLAALMGAATVTRGKMIFAGCDLLRLPSHRRARLGLGWVPQERDIFASLTVEENLAVVARPGPWTLERVYSTFPRLSERRGNPGQQLSGGEQQMLAIGRALMLNPKLLLLDEPLEGLAPIIVRELLDAIGRLVRDEGMSVVLVEQHAQQVLPLTQRALVLERGRIVHWATSAALLADPTGLDRWLGVTV